MQTIEIPPGDWARSLNEFSAMHDGWLISIDVLSNTLGAQPQIRELPLRGISAELRGADSTIAISAARADGEHITHIIHAPTRVRIERTPEGADVALQIESAEGTAAIVRFKTATLPVTVDGLPRHR
jgi:uncharacterized protein DUF5335